ncbi:MAG: hypothetical protein ABFQ65_03230 [Nanoarchaeota archaeon]
MNDIMFRVNQFFNSGRKLEELSFETMKSWVEAGKVKDLPIYSKENATIFFEAGEFELSLSPEKIILDVGCGEQKIYQGLDVQKLYNRFQNIFYPPMLEEEVEIIAKYSEN